MSIKEPTGDVITDSDDSVTVEQTPTDEPTGDVITDDPVETPVENEPVNHESGDDYWKNKAMELERKQHNLSEQLPTMIEDAVAKGSKPQEQQYTIEQLEAYALENPQQRPLVEAEKEKIRKRDMHQMLEQHTQQVQEKSQQAQTRERSENAVSTDPRYADAFVTSPNGQKSWNHQSKLTQLIGQKMQDPRLSNQPDGILFAAQLARLELIDSGYIPATQNKLKSLQRQNASLKQQTMSEGGGVSAVPAGADSFQNAKERLRREGTKDAAVSAVSEYMKRRNNA